MKNREKEKQGVWGREGWGIIVKNGKKGGSKEHKKEKVTRGKGLKEEIRNREKESKEECRKGQAGKLSLRMGRREARRNIRKER